MIDFLESYLDELTKLSAASKGDRKDKVEDIAKNEAQRVAKRTVKKVVAPTYMDLLRTAAKGARKVHIPKIGQSNSIGSGNKETRKAPYMAVGGSLGAGVIPGLLALDARSGQKNMLEGYSSGIQSAEKNIDSLKRLIRRSDEKARARTKLLRKEMAIYGPVDVFGEKYQDLIDSEKLYRSDYKKYLEGEIKNNIKDIGQMKKEFKGWRGLKGFGREFKHFFSNPKGMAALTLGATGIGLGAGYGVHRLVKHFREKKGQLYPQHQFQGQMNRFLKDLQRTKRTKPNIFGEGGKRKVESIYFPQQGQRP